MREFNLDNIKEVKIKDGVIEILYIGGVRHVIKEDVKLIQMIHPSWTIVYKSKQRWIKLMKTPTGY